MKLSHSLVIFKYPERVIKNKSLTFNDITTAQTSVNVCPHSPETQLNKYCGRWLEVEYPDTVSHFLTSQSLFTSTRHKSGMME